MMLPYDIGTKDQIMDAVSVASSLTEKTLRIEDFIWSTCSLIQGMEFALQEVLQHSKTKQIHYYDNDDYYSAVMLLDNGNVLVLNGIIGADDNKHIFIGRDKIYFDNNPLIQDSVQYFLTKSRATPFLLQLIAFHQDFKNLNLGDYQWEAYHHHGFVSRSMFLPRDLPSRIVHLDIPFKVYLLEKEEMIIYKDTISDSDNREHVIGINKVSTRFGEEPVHFLYDGTTRYPLPSIHQARPPQQSISDVSKLLYREFDKVRLTLPGIRRRSWRENEFVTPVVNQVFGLWYNDPVKQKLVEGFKPSIDDLMGTDWEFYSNILDSRTLYDMEPTYRGIR